MFKKISILLLIFVCCGYTLVGQTNRPLSFLDFNTDVRGAGMGNTTMGEAKGMYIYTNPTSLLNGDLNNKIYGSYTFGLFPPSNEGRQLFHAASAGYRFCNNHAIMVGFRDLEGLSIPGYDINGNSTANIKPKDMAMDLTYAYKFNEHFSAYIGGSFIMSTLDNSAITGGANAGFYYNNSFSLMKNRGTYTIGLSLYDFGGKIQYGNGDSAFMPASAGIGGSVSLPFHKNHILNAALSTKYYILPTTASAFTASIGLEYELFNIAAIRTGYYVDTHNMQNSYYSVGVGLKYKFIGIDAAYCLRSNKDFNIIRLGLSFELGNL